MTNDDHNKPQDKAVKSSSKKQSNSDKSIKKAKRIDKDVQRLQAKELRDVKVEGLKNQDLVADKSHQQLLGEQQALPDETLLTSTKDLTEIDSKQIKEFADAESESLKPDAASKAIAGAALVEDPLVDDTKASVARVGKGGGGNGASSHWLTTHSLLNHVGATGITSNHSGHVEGSHYKPSVTVQQLTHVNHSQTDQQPAPVMHAEGAQQQSGAVKEDKVSEVSGELHVSGVDANQVSWTVESGSGVYGQLFVDPHTGQWRYQLDNALATTNALAEGEHHSEQFVVVVKDNLQHQIKMVVSIEVEGSNDKPQISGLHHANVTEMAALSEVDGQLFAKDPDHNEQLQWSVSHSQGQYGQLTINPDNGQWQYQLDNQQPATLALTEGQKGVEHFVVSVTDSAGEMVKQDLSIQVLGTNEQAIIGGGFSGALIEDKDLHQGQLHADGVLTVTDVDNGQNQFQATVQQGQFGSLSINELGHWTYTADNSQTVIQGLKTGESLTDTLVVHSVDGTEQKITVTINGTDDKAVIGGTSTASLTEDKDLHQGQLHVDGTLTVTDLDYGQNQFQAGVQQGQFGSLSINELGHWTYTADNSQAVIQGLRTGESLTDTVLVRSVDGTEQKITVTINGTDDKAVIGGTSTASLTEDKDLHQGQLHVDGTLTVTDVDNGQNQFQATVQLGQFGTLSINDLGHWTYTADNSQQTIQGLKTGESLTDTLVVHSFDGNEQKITVTINGTDDKAAIAGTSTAQLTEDKDLHQGQLHVDGTLTVTDVDNGQNQFQAGVLQGQFGTLSINNLGHWTYTADNSQPNIQGLKTGESLTDTLVVHSIDGTERKVTVTINGTDDKAVIAGTSTAQLTEDKDLHQGQLHVDGALTVTDVDNGQNQFQATVQQGQFGTLSLNGLGHWTYTADNSQQAIQGLKTGESLTDTLIVHSVDGTEQKISVTINGTDDKAVIAGTSTASLAEDINVHQGQLRADGALTVSDADAGQAQFSATSLQGQFGTLSINALGHWTYNADNSQTAIQGLKTGQSLTDNLLIHSLDGTEQKVTVTINGSDDKAVISGTATATLTEDKDVHQGQLHADGVFTVTDLDNGENQFQATVQQGHFGTLSINNLGHWAYTADNSQTAIQGLKTGESLTDTLIVHSVDGTEQKISVTINGTDDKAVIAGTSTAQLTEDKDVRQGQLHVDGILTDNDADNGQNQFQAEVSQGQFGALSINNLGHWTYTADNSQTVIQGLKTGESLTDTLVVHSVDGTEQKISVTINGTDDKAVISGTATASLTEDKDVHQGQLHVDGALTVTDVDTGQNQFQATVQQGQFGALSLNELGHWTYTADNSQSAIQGLKTGESLTDTLIVHSVDGSEQKISVTINGTDDKAVIGGTNSAQLTEDKDVHQGQLHVDGALTVTDVDSGQNQFQATVQQGQFGSLSLNELGHWTYTADNSQPAIQGLKTGESLTDTLIVHSVDGTEQKISVTINGTDDKAVITGISTGDVDEGHGSFGDMSPDYAQPGMAKLGQSALTADGKLNIVDPDTGESQFDPKGGAWNNSYHGQYGHLLLNSDGTWHYDVTVGSVDWVGNRKTTIGSTIDKLGEGQTLTDTITIQSKDGTTHDIVITIHGDNDRPYISSEVTLSTSTEDTALTFAKADLLTNTVDVDANDAGKLTIENLVSDHGSILDNKDGTYTFTPEKDYNGQVHFSYDVKDAHGGVTHTGATTSLSAVRDAAIITEVTSENITEDGSNGSHNQGITTELANGRLQVVDPDSGENSFQYSQFGETRIHDPFNGHLRIDSAGNWGYSVDNANLQHLAEGQTEVVTYRVHSKDGTPFDLNINVIGTNDAPVANIVTLSNGTEDTHYQMQASQFGFGDIDSGDTLHSIAITDLPPTTEGKFVLDGHDITAGQSIATADISKLQFIPAKDFNGDVQFKYTVNDGHVDSAKASNTLHITATDDASVIGGDTQGNVDEANIGDTTTATGHLTITDVDTGQNPTFVDVASTATTYGHIEMHNGQWTYTLDQSKVQQLDPDQVAVVDHHTFTASDGSTQVVDITISGTNDKPIIESAHAAPVGTSSTLKLQDVDIVSNPTGANIDVAATDGENVARWGTDITGVASGVKLIGLYKPGSDHNWITTPATTSTAHSGAGGYNRVDNHDWWHANGIPDTVNTGSGGASGHGNVWSGGIVVFEDALGHQTIGIINRVCTGGGGEVDYLYYHAYQNLQVGSTAFSGTAAAGETITVMDGANKVASVVADSHGHWQVAANHLADGLHTLHVENSAGQHSAETVFQVSGNTVSNITPAGLDAELKEDAAQITIDGELRTSDIDSGDSASFNAQAQHSTQYGHFSLDANGKYHYTIDNTNPTVNQLGVNQTLTEVIPVTSTSTDGSTVTNNITITIHGSVDHPSLSASAPDAQQGAVMDLNLNVATTDTGGDTESLLIKISGLPDHAILNHGTYDNIAKMWVLDKTDLTGLTLDLKDPHFHGDLQINVTATASAGGESQSTTQPVTIFVNQPPQVSAPVTGSKTEDSGMGAIDLLHGATDADSGDLLSVGDLQYQIGTAGQTANKPGFLTLGKDGHTLVINANAAEFQHLSAGENETITVSYNVKDSHGGQVAQNATITITGTDDTAQISGHISTDERTHITEDVRVQPHGHILSSDKMTLQVTDPDSSENYFIPTGATGTTDAHSNGAWVNGDNKVGQFILHASGEWYFKADNNSTQIDSLGDGEEITDMITVHSADGTPQQLTAVVYGSNDRPTITTQAISANEDSDYQFTLANFGFTDVDSHDSLDHITINSLPDPVEGVLLINGIAVSVKQQISAADISHLTFKPALNFNGDVQFNYSVNDGHADSASTNATLTVANVNDIPTVIVTTDQTSEDISGGLLISKAQLLIGASDIDGDSLDITSVTVPTSQGSVTDNHDGTWTFNPAHDFKGDATLSYKVSDGSAQVDNHMTVSVSPVTDKAAVQLSLTTEQHVMQFATHDAGGVTNNGALQTHGDIDNLAVEFNIIGGPTAPPAGHNGPTLVSYGTSHSDNEFYVWDPTNLTIRINNVEYKTGVSATDGLTHRYSVLWSSATGHLELLVDGESKWVNPTPVAKGYQIPGNGVLAIGNDQDNYQIETGSHTNHGFSVNDAFSGQMFSATLATTAVTAGQLKNAPLSSVVDKNHGLVIDMRMNAHGDFVDTTGHHQVTPTANVHSQTSMVDTSVAIPNADALVHLNLLVTAPTDSSDVITKTVITGLIKGTVLDDGHGHSHTITGMVEQVDIQHWNLPSLTAQLPGSNTQNMNIGLIVTTQGPDGATATNSHYQHLVLDPTKPIPDAVIGGDIQGNTDEVTAITGQLTITDTDPSQAHFIAQVIPTTHGEFTINESGHWSFTPNSTAQTLTQGNNATDIVTFKTVDGSEQQLSVNLVGSDTAPTTVVTNLGQAETGAPHIIQAAELLANVSDVDTLASGLSIVANSLTSPHGSFTSNADGSFNFVANAGFVGNDLEINFKVTDGHNQIDAKGVIDVVPPLAITRLGHDTGVSDSDFVTSDGHLVVYGTGEPGATITGTGLLQGLKTTVGQDGQWQLDASSTDRADGTWTLVIFEVKSDGSFHKIQHSVTIDTAKPTIAIEPISKDDWVDHNEHLQALTVSGTCTHVTDGDNVDITLAGQHYSAIVNNNHWQVVIPAAETASISDNAYQVHAEVAATATGDTAGFDRNIIVSADLSTLVQTETTAEDTKTAGSGSLFAIGASNIVTSTGVLHGNYGSLQMNADGSYQYTLDNHKSDIQEMSQGQSQADNFFVTYTNPHGDIKHAVLNVGIHGTNDAPILTGTFEISRSVTTGSMTNTHSFGYINIEELDKGDTLSYEYIDSQGISHPLDFTAGHSNKIDVAGIGYFNIDADGRWDFTLSNSGPERDNMNHEIASGKIHTESVQLKVTDSAGASREETLTVHIGDGKTGPQIFGASASVVTEDKVTQSHGLLDLLVNDVKVANGVTWELQPSTQPLYGDLTLAADGSWQYQAHNNAAKVQALAEGERLEETIMVTATDGHGHSVDQAMKLVIIGTNDVPVVAHALSSKVIEDHLLTLNRADLLANVEDKDGLDKLDVSQLQLIGGGSIVQQGEHWVINPGINFNGNLRLTYQVSDGHVAIDNAMSIHVSPDADTPTMIFTKHVGDLSSPLDSFAIQGNENTDLALNINVASPDSNETLSVEISGLPSGASLSAGSEHNGIWTLQQNELTNLKVIPDSNYHGHFSLSVTATSHDGIEQASVSQTIGVDVLAAPAQFAGIAQSDAPQSDTETDTITFSSSIDSDFSDAVSTGVTSDPIAPVDHYFQMLGMSRDDAPSESLAGSQTDLLPEFNVDNSLADEDDMAGHSPNPFDNPLAEGEEQHHQLDDVQDHDHNHNHNHNQLVDDNTAMDSHDDELLHSALNNMHNQW